MADMDNPNESGTDVERFMRRLTRQQRKEVRKLWSESRGGQGGLGFNEWVYDNLPTLEEKFPTSPASSKSGTQNSYGVDIGKDLDTGVDFSGPFTGPTFVAEEEFEVEPAQSMYDIFRSGGGGGGGKGGGGGGKGGGKSGGAADDDANRKAEGLTKLVTDLSDSLLELNDTITVFTDDLKKKVDETFKKWQQNLVSPFSATWDVGLGGEPGSPMSRGVGSALPGMGKALGMGAEAIGSLFGPQGALVGKIIGEVAVAGGKLASVFLNSIDILKKWDQAALASSLKFAEFSASMSMVKAEQQVRDIELAHRHGESQAGSARDLAQALSNLNETLAPVEDMFAAFSNEALAILTNSVNLLIQIYAVTSGIASILGWFKSEDDKGSWTINLANEEKWWLNQEARWGRGGFRPEDRRG